MLYSSIWIGLLISYGTILAEDIVPHGTLHPYISHATNQTSRTGRFGFSVLNELRQSFCRSFCTSADTMPYLINLLCATKCPELYLPHHTTTEASMSSTVTMAAATTPSTTAGTNVPTTTMTPLPMMPTSSSEQNPSSASTTTPSSTTTSTATPNLTTTSTTTPSSTTTSTTTPSSTTMLMTG